MKLKCNGTREVCIKTLHGKFSFDLQKYQVEKKELNYFELTNQLPERFVSYRLQELCGYYGNRLSYSDIQDLVERTTGKNLLSDQTIWSIIIAKASNYSQQIQDNTHSILTSKTVGEIKVNPVVDIYATVGAEILLFDDAIQVKGQKVERDSLKESIIKDKTSNTTPTKTPAIITDVAMLQTPKGCFEYLIAPLDINGKTTTSLAEVVRAQILDFYGKAAQPLNIVAITDGAKTIRNRLLAIFGVTIVLILDWYHLCKKVRNLMSMIALNKMEKSKHLKVLLSQLWQGQTTAALEYLKHGIVARNHETLKELIGYLEKHQSEIIDYQRRSRAGKTIGSGRMEKGVDLYFRRS